MEDEGGEKKTKKRRCEVSREGISRNWANLPVDILWLINTQLCYFGRIRFRGVCKSWRESCHTSSCDRLPLLMSFNPSNLMKSCEFISMSVHDQVCDNTSRIDNPTYAEDNGDMDHLVLSSKKGWLLLAAQEKSYQLVIYNPFKKETIKLPTVYFAANRRLRSRSQAEMSGSPEERGFMVFVIDGLAYSFEKENIRIATWQRGDTTWKNYSFESPGQSPTCCFDVVYSRKREMFYCLFGNQRLGTFNPMAGEWSFLEPWIEKSTFAGGDRLIETEEEPLLFFKKHVFKLDRSSSRVSWVKENDLGNRIVFITYRGYGGCWNQTNVIAVPAEGELRNLANRVYCNLGNSTWFYSLGPNKRHRCFTNKEPATPEDNNNNPEIFSKRVWIEPPLPPLEYPME